GWKSGSPCLPRVARAKRCPCDGSTAFRNADTDMTPPADPETKGGGTHSHRPRGYDFSRESTVWSSCGEAGGTGIGAPCGAAASAAGGGGVGGAAAGAAGECMTPLA